MDVSVSIFRSLPPVVGNELFSVSVNEFEETSSFFFPMEMKEKSWDQKDKDSSKFCQEGRPIEATLLHN
jgi:hypothetical protein